MVILWGWVLDVNPTFFSSSKWRPFKQIKELTIVLSLRENCQSKKISDNFSHYCFATQIIVRTFANNKQ